MMRHFYLKILHGFMLFLFTGLVNANSLKPRIIVTTDITNEPDDQESLVRLLVYADEFSIEGLIGSTGIWKLSNPATHVIHECIDAYGQVRENLLLHDPDYPTADELHTVTCTGNRAYGMSGVGERGSAGADLIIRAVDKKDPRPVWLLAWGGCNTIAQAIWTVRDTRSPEALSEFLDKIRVYDLAGQDDAGAWIAHHFPNVFFIRNVLAYKGMSFRFSSSAWDHTRGGNESVVTRAWVKANIQNGHGALGCKYPDALHLWEGDTPTWFYVLPNGLNDPEQPWHGSWGGRFSRDKKKNVNIAAQEYAGASCKKGCWVNEAPYLDYWVYADAEDEWAYQGKSWHNQWAPIFRWRSDFQNDFAARMDWCVKKYEDANHNPRAIVNGDETTDVMYHSVSPGSEFKLDASGSADPDGDILTFDWWIYPEAGSYQGKIEICQTNSSQALIHIPGDIQEKELHVILTLQDSGHPQLTAYRRIVLKGKSKR